ncbi:MULTISPECIES: class I SAM-dependent methyltransferase [unclassified Prochlorococcus]|uniref:class I SAM-dependent methyltransferase n=1 Tax=unclassified Prochlorococcus TaxID=2627481 RepID=UPI000533B902|nr:MULTISPECIES: methyltransferase domain-containing protein [unclassified Prochlorococcus]KGG16190.1 hypothetical protein EV07_1357 [Prochlorococcus sp. MIT 0603]KGG18075.1 hypothetical protein EV06_0203 [Prochlorococcus sp. MIT 0602]
MSVQLLSDYQRSKDDNTDDSIFYSQPRFVHHLDEAFRQRLTALYREKIKSSCIILDLMSSWVSHLPKEIKYKKVIGHGLNLIELEKNKRLDSHWVQDLNSNQNLPLDDDSIDVCLMVAAWQYLQYPENLALELRRVIRDQGQLIISFSNRAFWSKAPKVWTEGSDFDHINYIKNVLSAQGWPEPEYIYESTKREGALSFLMGHGDPFFSVLASNI